MFHRKRLAASSNSHKAIAAMTLTLLFCLCAVSLAWSDETEPPEGELVLDQGTVRVGGDMAFILYLDRPETGEDATYFANWMRPGIGWFLADGLELKLEGVFGTGTGAVAEERKTELGVNAGFQYTTKAGIALYPSLGVRAGVNYQFPEEGDPTGNFVIYLPLGFYIPIRERLAVSIGLDIVFEMALEQSSRLKIYAPIAFFGWHGLL